MKRTYDPRKVKRHRSYTVKDLAALYGVGPNTVRQWIRNHDLPVIEGSYPVMMHWTEIRQWMAARQAARKWTCGADEMSCFKCRGPRKVRAGTFCVVNGNKPTPTLKGDCDICETPMNRATSQARLQADTANLATDNPTHNAPLIAHTRNPKPPLNPSL